MNVLGVRVDNLSEKETQEKVSDFLSEYGFHQITTINPEFILEAQKDADFRQTLNDADLNVADGFGIKFAFWRFGEKLKCRMPGADLMEEIFKIAEKNNYKIFLVANGRGLSSWEETSQSISQRFPKLEIAGVNLDYKNQEKVQSSKFKVQSYEIILANFGAPDQEIFLNSLKTAENSKIKLVMGVGGSFDYLTGKIRRAPIWMRKIGIEWLWRLIQQPWRLKRIINATIFFPIRVIFSR